MPGLVGLMSAHAADRAAERFASAVTRMSRVGRLVASTSALEGRCLVGQVEIRERTPACGWTDDGVRVFFHGCLYNEKELRAAAVAAQDASIEALVAAVYAKHGLSFVEHLDGEFVVAVLDAEGRRLLLATDSVGNHPLYWRHDSDGFIFASDLSAILAATPSARRLDLRAVADYLTIGAVLGDKTLAEGVHALDPGTVLTCDLMGGQVARHQYLELANFFVRRFTDKRAYMAEVTAAFEDAVARAMAVRDGLGLALSGGLDSRAILGASGSHARDLETYTLGIEGCADQAIARRLSRIGRTRHHFFRLDESYLKDFLPSMKSMVSLTDGLYVSHGLTEMLALRFLGQTNIEVLVRGHAGELAKTDLAWPLHTDAHVCTLTTTDQLVNYLSARANYITRGLPLVKLLAPGAAKLAGDGSRSALAAVLSGTGLNPAEACSYLYLRELNRRFTVASLELFRSRVDIRLPYANREFLRVLLAGDPKWREGTQIHQELIRAGMPRLLAVRNANTGASAGAGPRTEFILDKFNTLFKRLNLPGYRHYHNFDNWMRNRLFESVESELLSSEGRVQAFVPRATLVTLIRESREGVADRSYLLQILLILELWQRENGVEAVA